MAEQNLQQTISIPVGISESNRIDVLALTFTNAPEITFSVSGGECVVIAGPSGSGKSRLLRAIADLDPGPADQAGVIKLDDIDHLSYGGAEWRRQVAYLAAESQWWFDDVASHFPEPPSVEDLQALGLSATLLQRPVSRLSTGERQRLALLRLLAGKPRVLLLDEPTAALDPRSTRAVERLVMEYRDHHRAAVIWVSHDIDQAKRIASRYFSFDRQQFVEADIADVSSDGELS